MAQANRLRKLKITRVALCRQGLDPEAHIMLYKSADKAGEESEIGKREFDPEQRRGMAATGVAMSDGSYPIQTARDVRVAMRAFGEGGNSKVKRHIIKRASALGHADLIPEDWMATKNDNAGSLDIESLDDDVKAHIASLQKSADDAEAAKTKAETERDEAIAKAAAEKPEPKVEDDIMKSLPKEVQERLAKAEKDAEDSRNAVEKLIKSGKEREAVAKAKAELPKLTEHEVLGKALAEIEDTMPDEYKVVERVLKAANAQIEAGKVFGETGGVGSSANLGEAHDKIAKAADELQKSDPKLTRAQAETQVVMQHPEWYAEATPGQYVQS